MLLLERTLVVDVVIKNFPRNWKFFRLNFSNTVDFNILRKAFCLCLVKIYEKTIFQVHTSSSLVCPGSFAHRQTD